MMNKIILLICFLFYSLSCFSKPIPADLLFQNKFFENPKLSHSGGLLAGYMPSGKDEKLFVILDTQTNRLTEIAAFHEGYILDEYYWLNEEHILISFSKSTKDKYEDHNTVIKLNRSSSGLFNPQSHILKFEGHLVNALPDEKDTVLFDVYNYQEQSGYAIRQHPHSLFEIEINDLMSFEWDQWNLIDRTKEPAYQYGYDPRSRVFMAKTFDAETETITYFTKERSKTAFGDAFSSWDEVITLQTNKPDEVFEMVGIIDDTRYIVLTNHESEHVGAYRYNVDAEEFTLLYEHDSYDLVSASMTENGTLETVGYFDKGAYTTEFIEKNADGKTYKKLRKAFPNKSVSILSQAEESKKSIVFVNSDDDAGAYYYFNGKSNVSLISPAYPKLESYAMAKTVVNQVEVAPGIEIESYFTPAIGDNKQVLLVMPHGGPIGIRDTVGYSPQLQYFASRGFNILRVNFRGSEGFGKEFKTTGRGQFGEQIEQDISKAVDQLLQTEKFDKVCSIGASYGGYSAVMLAIKHPDIYDCVVSRYGIYDLPLLFSSRNAHKIPSIEQAIENVVGKNTEDLLAISPIYLANKIQQPILLIAGQKDKVAAFEHANRFNHVLKKLDKDVQTQFYKYVGHGWHRTWKGDIHEHDLIARFLDQQVKNLKVEK